MVRASGSQSTRLEVLDFVHAHRAATALGLHTVIVVATFGAFLVSLIANSGFWVASALRSALCEVAGCMSISGNFSCSGKVCMISCMLGL